MSYCQNCADLESRLARLEEEKTQALRRLGEYQETLVQLGPTKLWAVRGADEPVKMPEPETLANLLDRLAQAEVDRDTWKANQRQVLKERDEGYRLWKKAEAREAAMRMRAEQIAQCEWYGNPVAVWREHASHSSAHDACHAALDILEASDAALSSDAGRAKEKMPDDYEMRVIDHLNRRIAQLEGENAALAAEVEKLRKVARVLENTTPEALRQLVVELFIQGRSAWAYLFTDLTTSLDALSKVGTKT